MRVKVELTETQKDYLLANYGKIRNKEIQSELGLTRSVFYNILKEMGLTKSNGEYRRIGVGRPKIQ